MKSAGLPSPPEKPPETGPVDGSSVGRLLLKIVAVLLVLETAVHGLIGFLGLGGAEGLVDSLLLSAFAAPVFYLWISRYLRKEVELRRSLRKSESSASGSEERYRALFQNLSLGVTLVDSEFQVLMVNPAIERMLGKPASELEGRRCFRAFERREQVCSHCPGRPAMESGKPQEARIETELEDGRTLHVRIQAFPVFGPDGKAAGFTEIVEDITETERGERSLRDVHLHQAALNDLLRISVQSLPQPLKLTRMLECLLATPWFEVSRKGAVFARADPGLAMAAQVGLSDELRLSCARLAPGQCLCGRSAETGEEALTTNLDGRHKTYAGIHDHGHCILPLRAGEENLGVLCLYLKAGVPLRAEQLEFARSAAGVFSGVMLLAKADERLLQSQKMDAVGRLAGGVAHDFNNILTAILGYSGFLLQGLGAGDPRRQDLEEIKSAGERGASLTRQLLAFSRKQVLQLAVLDLNAAVRETRNMLARLIGENIELAAVLSPEPLPVEADPGQLAQVILNLAINARDAMPRRGTLTIETSTHFFETPHSHGHGVIKPGRYAVLSVGDTGCGMSKEVQSHLFEPFFTTKERGKGTGLGLSTVYGIVAQINGQVTVSSEEGRGTVFRVYLPLSKSALDAAPGPAQEISLRGAGTILVVEDEKLVRTLIRRILVQAGFEVLEAAGGAEALDLCRRRKGPILLMVTDVVMPGMSGPETAAHLSRLRPGTKVLFMSGYLDQPLAGRDRFELSKSFIAKPFSSAALIQKIQETLNPAC